MTKNLGNYESQKLEIEAAPSDGQTADSLLAEVNDYLMNQLSSTNGTTEKAKPPLADKPKQVEKKPDPIMAGSAPSGECSTETSPPKKTTKSRSSGKAAKQAEMLQTEARKVGKFVLDAETFEEFHDRLVEYVSKGDALPLEERATIYREIYGYYKTLNGKIGALADQKVMNDCITLIQSANNKIADERRKLTEKAA
jgi:hypothetical protein